MRQTTKKIHGEPIPLWEKLGLQPFPPVECYFSVGDKVIYTNDYGAKFIMFIAGFSEEINFYGGFIHLTSDPKSENGSAFWFAHLPQELSRLDDK